MTGSIHLDGTVGWRRIIVCLILAVFSFLVYEITSYGGIRSPDSEIMFRTSDALVTHGSFAVEEGLKQWKGFGLAQGSDGRRYSIFGPGEALAATPLIAAGQGLANTGFFRNSTFRIPVSLYVDNGLGDFVNNQPPSDRDGNAVRWFAAQLNVLISALSVALFFLIAFRFSGSTLSAIFTALIYGFGTLVWSYSGTFFSEPLASLLALMAFYMLLTNDPRFWASSPRMTKTLLAGLLLGGAVATHITAILFVPFFFLYAVYPYLDSNNKRRLLTPALGFSIGLGSVLLLLGYYNHVRFGNFMETGRSVDLKAAARFGYGVFTNPLQGFYGLLFSPDKGIFLFSPVAVVAFFAWPRLHRLHPFLSRLLAAAIVFRIAFIASRSDWDGGFCLGPRYLVMILPYLCLPLTLLVKDLFQTVRKDRRLLFISAWLFICQQYYFSLGEIFSHYFLRVAQSRGGGTSLRAIKFIWSGTTHPFPIFLVDFEAPFSFVRLI